MERTEETVAAIHEAGHAVVAWFSPAVSEVTLAEIRPGGAGAVTYTIDLRSAFAALVVSLAGVAAEVLVFGRGEALQAASDLTSARTMARRLTTLPKVNVPTLPTLPFSRLFYTRLSAPEHAALSLGFRMATFVILRHQTRFYQTASLLLASRSISQHELKTVLGDRTFLRVVWLAQNAASRSFFLPRQTWRERLGLFFTFLRLRFRRVTLEF